MESILPAKEFEGNKDNLNDNMVVEAINGSKESFIVLIDMYKSYLYKTAFLYLKNEHDASEVYQNTVYKAYINIHKLKNSKQFKTWITRILINNIHDTFRKSSREIVIDDVEETEDFTQYIGLEDKIDLYDAIDTLNYNFKTAIILRYIHDMSIKDISEVMHCSENTVKSYLHRAKKALLKNLRGE